jgi:adenylyltransferase/sulfurtransferase
MLADVESRRAWRELVERDMSSLSPRYARQVSFPAIGKAGQERLLASRVAIVGAGAIGSVAAEQLARSGVGRIAIVDRDVVESSNLGRQASYTPEDAERRIPKAIALAGHLAAINPEIVIEPVVADLSANDVESILTPADLVLDGTDNLETRYLLNDFAVARGRAWIYGGCVGARGITAVVVPGRTPCLRCIYPDPPPRGTLETCETAGVIAPIANLVASLQVVEALKLLVGAEDAVRRTWIAVELWPFRLVEIGAADSRPRPDCPCCGRMTFPFLEDRGRPPAATLCGRDAVHVSPRRPGRVDLDAVAKRLETLGAVRRLPYVLAFSAGAHDVTLFDDGRALVKGTSDPALARSIYDRFIGS